PLQRRRRGLREGRHLDQQPGRPELDHRDDAQRLLRPAVRRGAVTAVHHEPGHGTDAAVLVHPPGQRAVVLAVRHLLRQPGRQLRPGLQREHAVDQPAVHADRAPAAGLRGDAAEHDLHRQRLRSGHRLQARDPL
ncbi:MAG: hypothetical protein AVDCRST_MAG07-2167, partial [uncultured Frankineae bacterium]